MLTLSYGFKKPQNLDEGDVVFPALETNWQRVNDHTHDGSNSAKINSRDITRTTVDVLSTNWSLVADGHYTQNITLPLSLNYDTVTLAFKLSTGEQVYPSVSKVSTSVVKVDFDDNTQDLTCYVV